MGLEVKLAEFFDELVSSSHARVGDEVQVLIKLTQVVEDLKGVGHSLISLPLI